MRHSFSIQLTEEGILLRKRAEDLIKMADKITTNTPKISMGKGQIMIFCSIGFLRQYGKVNDTFIQFFSMRYFLAVAREENMTRAAELLHVTQPALSKQLKGTAKSMIPLSSFSVTCSVSPLVI